MNTKPFATDLWGRLKRGLIVLAGFAVAGLSTWVVSDDFADLVTDHPGIAVYVPVVTAVLTQIAGHLAGKAK